MQLRPVEAVGSKRVARRQHPGNDRRVDVKFLSGISFLFAISMFLNAIDGVWAFDRVSTGTKWIVLDVLIGLILLLLSYFAYRIARTQAYVRQQELTPDERRSYRAWTDDP
jgi:hypothetical protein